MIKIIIYDKTYNQFFNKINYKYKIIYESRNYK